MKEINRPHFLQAITHKFDVFNCVRKPRAVCHSRISLSTNQSFVKYLAKPTQEKLFVKISQPLKKNKKRHLLLTHDTQNPTIQRLSGWAEKNASCQQVVTAIGNDVKIEAICSYQLCAD